MPPNLAYDFVAPPKIVFGWGRRRELPALARPLGHRAMILCGLPAAAATDVLGEVREMLAAQEINSALLETILHEPEVQDVDRVAIELRGYGQGRGNFLLAIGGGAAIDLAKAAAVLATNRQSPTIADYLEGVGRGLKIVEPPLPVVAMPTTAGTGAEATRNAVVSSYDPPFKKSIRDDRILPRVVLVDPELTVTRAAARDSGQRHGRDHAAHRELCLAKGPADSAGPGAARAAVGNSLACRGGGERRLPPGAGADGAVPRCFPAWRWPIPAWGWRTAWRQRWAYTAACRTEWPAR